MKFSLATLLTLGATTVLAQNPDNQTEAFYLRLGSTDSSLNNHYLYSCHAGAAIEGLCIDQDDKSGLTNSNVYFQNYTEYNEYEGHPVGTLVWNLLVTLPDVGLTNYSQAMSLQLNPVSNTAVPLFGFQDAFFGIAFDAEEKMFIASYYNDAVATPGQYPPSNQAAYYRWHVCWTYVGGYYYQALVQITGGAPVNPTCVPVNVTREWF